MGRLRVWLVTKDHQKFRRSAILGAINRSKPALSSAEGSRSYVVNITNGYAVNNNALAPQTPKSNDQIVK